MTATEEVPMPELGINTASHAGIRIRGYTADQLRAYADARCSKETTALLGLLADIRKDAGDPTGKLDWTGLVEHIAQMRAERDGAR
jgi:hypothetical protein